MDQMLRERELGAAIGLARSTCWSQVADGLLPAPVKMTPRASRWPASEIAQVIAARIAGRTDDDIRKLVARLHAARQVAVDRAVAAHAAMRTPDAKVAQ